MNTFPIAGFVKLKNERFGQNSVSLKSENGHLYVVGRDF